MNFLNACFCRLCFPVLTSACCFGQSMSAADVDGESDDYGYYYESDSEDLDGADVADELAGEYTPQAVVTSGYASEQRDFQEENMDGFATDGRGFYPSMLVCAALAPHLHNIYTPFFPAR